MLFSIAEQFAPATPPPPLRRPLPRPPKRPRTALSDHTILVGFGRVGGIVGLGLKQAGKPFLVVEDDEDRYEALEKFGIERIYGNAARPTCSTQRMCPRATLLIVAIPNGFEAGAVVMHAKAAEPENTAS